MAYSLALQEYMQKIDGDCPVCKSSIELFDWDTIICPNCSKIIVIKRVQTEKDHFGVNLPKDQWDRLPDDALIVLLDGGVWRSKLKKDTLVKGPIRSNGRYPSDFYVAQADSFDRMGA